MSPHGYTELHKTTEEYLTGLIGYTAGGVPFPLNPGEKVHRSVLAEVDSEGRTPVRLYFQRDKPAFVEAIKEYKAEHDRRNNPADLPRWNLDDTVNGAEDKEAPVGPSRAARVKR